MNPFSSLARRSVEANATVKTPALDLPRIQGWCPGALRPMLSGDGLVVRIRPHAGRLTPTQASGIAALSRRFGNGMLDVTSRANLQLRGVTQTTHPALVEGLRDLDLIDASPEVEARRNIVVSPFWNANDGTLLMTAALTEALASPDAPTLPGKFGFAVDCGEETVLRATSADIRIERGAHAYVVWAEGFSTGAMVAAFEAVPAAMELARWFLANGGGTAGRGRMAALAPIHPLPARFQATAVLPTLVAKPQPGPVANGWLVGAEFGQMQAETFADLSTLGALRITPWQMLLVEGATCAPQFAGLISEADDPRLRVVACTGAPGCLQAAATTRPLARTLAEHVPAGRLLHVSGCTKGCAHPKASLTLVATAAGFDLIGHGTASSPPELRALPPAAIAFHLIQAFHAPPI